MADAELVKLVDVGELSRDFGLDITVSDGGLVTSALNQRQYRAECGKIYQEFMLSMADYIFEETQLKKRLQGLLLQKKQPHFGKSEKNDADEASPEIPEGNRDEDAFSPAQMEEFRRLANSRASNRSVSKAGVVAPGDLPRPPTSASVRAPSRLGGGGRADTPHIFPALKERPLTSTPTSRTAPRVGSATTAVGAARRQSVTSSAMMYGGRDQEYDGVMDPTADFSVNRRMRMNPRAFSRLSSAGRIKVKVLDKKGEFVMKPVVGRPGVVSVSGSGQSDIDDGEKHQVVDSKDKLALVKTATSFNTPTLASELKTNNLVAIQKSLLGKEAKRMTVGEVMAKSRDRRARLFRVQVSTGRLDDWDIPGEERLRPPTRATSAGGRSLERGGGGGGGPSRLGMNPGRRVLETNPHKRPETPAAEPKHTAEDVPATRAKTAPPNRPHVRSSSIPTPRHAPRGDGSLTARSLSQPRSRGRAEAKPSLSVVQLELEESAKVPSPPHPAPPAKSAPKRGFAVKRGSTSSSCAVFPVSAQNLAGEKKKGQSVTFSKGKPNKAEVTEAAEKECSVHIRHIHTLRDSAAVVRRWKELDRDREAKLNKWRMRMSFAATRRGNLGKVLAKA